MNKTKIEWTDYTWNPVTGCQHGCPYCYARKIAMRFDGHFNPTFHEKRLTGKMPKAPSKIFVCSMADLFGDWVPDEWVIKVLKVARQNPQHIFQFLTKNPKLYSEFQDLFTDNMWFGTTIDTSEMALYRLKQLEKVKGYKFISFEPLLGDMTGMDLSKIDLVIIGQMTGQGAIKAKTEWIESIKHHNIFYKSNLEQTQ